MNSVQLQSQWKSIFLKELEKLILKLIWKNKWLKIANTFLEEKKTGALVLPEVKTSYKAIINKI